MFKQFVVLSCLLGAAVSEAPYPASGWKPEGNPFDLPREYLPPQEEQLKKIDFEISQQRLDYIGQLRGSERFATNQPKESYLPPENPEDIDTVQDVLRVQGLPNRDRVQFRPFFPRPTSNQFRRPTSQQTLKFPPQQQQQRRPQVIIPLAKQYGAPDGKQISSAPEPRNLESDEKRNAIQALNAAVKAYTSGKEPLENVGYDYPATPEEKVARGQYFVLGPDNTLQRVTFTTSQDEEDVRTNGFTAQLKYTPVGEIHDPVFKYNDKGQLVRVFKK